ncbi:hypothetical protein [Streptomyces sp. NPDC017529]|uniref:hypothetical protein n=1 Tax=Streptomyces sp. NPDC017529 TaxID=3365000 RepID=UPI0037BB8514
MTATALASTLSLGAVHAADPVCPPPKPKQKPVNSCSTSPAGKTSAKKPAAKKQTAKKRPKKQAARKQTSRRPAGSCPYRKRKPKPTATCGQSAAKQSHTRKPAAEKPARKKQAAQGAPCRPPKPKPKPKPSAGCGGTAPGKQASRKPSAQKPSSQAPSAQRPSPHRPSPQKPSAQRPPAKKPPARKPPARKPAPKKPPQRRDHGWSWEGLYLDAADLRKVNVYLVRAKKAERTISPQVRAIARRTKATMVGYEDRLRSPEAIKRSVARELQENPTQTVDEVLGQINDSVRYILQWPDAQYVKAVKDTSALLVQWKNPNIRWSNTWGRPRGYKAINTAWRAGDSTHPYELQFHTPRSRAAQKESRELHEETRRPGTTSQRRAQLAAQQNRVFATVPTPKGAQLLRAPGRRV